MRPPRTRCEVPNRGSSRCLREIVALKRFKKLMRKNARKAYHSRVTVSSFIIFGTSIFVDHPLRTGRHSATNRFGDRSHSHIHRLFSQNCGAARRSPRSANSSERWRKIIPILTPTERNWLESGQIYSGTSMRTTGSRPKKLRDLHFEVLIALTARSHGARLITSNRSDFEIVNGYRKLQLEIW